MKFIFKIPKDESVSAGSVCADARSHRTNLCTDTRMHWIDTGAAAVLCKDASNADHNPALRINNPRLGPESHSESHKLQRGCWKQGVSEHAAATWTQRLHQRQNTAVDPETGCQCRRCCRHALLPRRWRSFRLGVKCRLQCPSEHHQTCSGRTTAHLQHSGRR